VEELQELGFRDGTVVDLGCGSGILASIVSQAGYRVIGMDISDAMVAIARERAPESEFLCPFFRFGRSPRLYRSDRDWRSLELCLSMNRTAYKPGRIYFGEHTRRSYRVGF
jgi:methylase of polypeptide subunit release factors